MRATFGTAAAAGAVVALVLVQTGAAGMRSLGNDFFGPKLVRAEVITSEGGAIHDYRVDRGRIRSVAPGSLTLLEKDGTLVSVPVAATADVTLRGDHVLLDEAPPRPRRDDGARRRRGRFDRRRHRPLRRGPVVWGGTALVVEDDESIAALVRSYLERDGFAVVRAERGEDALLEIERRPVRVVVLDVGLPDLDGFEVCSRIRRNSRVPILMLTARDEEPDRVTGLELGADDYLTKPFSPRELLARVKAVLRRAEPWLDEPALEGGRRRRSPGCERGSRRGRAGGADRPRVRPALDPARQLEPRADP